MVILITPIYIQPESIQHNACLATAKAVRGKPPEKLYKELDLQSLKLRFWF